jgi:hypothetical protein
VDRRTGPTHPEAKEDLLPDVLLVVHTRDLGDHLPEHQVTQVRVASPFTRCEPELAILPEQALDEGASVGYRFRGGINPPDRYGVAEP